MAGARMEQALEYPGLRNPIPGRLREAGPAGVPGKSLAAK